MHRNKRILYTKSDADEETSPISNIDSKVKLIEKKMNSIINRESQNISSSDYPIFASPSNSILKKIFEDKGIQNLWNRLSTLKTEEGFTVNHIIQPGLDCPDHPIGVVAYSKSCYYVFDEILVSIAQILHKRNLHNIGYKKENLNFLKDLFSNFNIKKNENKEKTGFSEDIYKSQNLYNTTNYEFLNKLFNENLLEVNISAVRNLDGYNFSSGVSRSQRRDISKKILEFIIKNQSNTLVGKYGKFVQFDPQSNKGLQIKDQNDFYRLCGFYRDWPDGRVIYFSKDDLLSIITNEEDHLKITFRAEQENFNPQKFSEFFDLLIDLEKNYPSAYDEHLGYLTSSPINLGKLYLY